MIFMRYWSRFRDRILLAMLVTLAVFLYSAFSFQMPWRFNSPDEAANAFFTLRLAQGESLAAPDEINAITQNPIVHPRSTHVLNGQLAPASFLGLSLVYGTIGRITGTVVLPYLTPLVAALGLLAFFGLVKELSGKQTAWLATALLIFTPAFWYYHSRAFFHNALFWDLGLLMMWMGYASLKKHAWWRYLLTGLFFGLAAAVRTSEVFWLTAAGILFLVLNWRQVAWRHLWLTALGALAAFCPVLFTNYHIYGSIFSVGYKQDLFLAGDLQQTLSLLEQLILPFGFHPRVVLSTVTNYLVVLTWWWAITAVAGVIYLFIGWRNHSREAKSFIFILLLIISWLITVYGSWQFNDNPDPSAVTLGTSYVRYWLPIYTLLLWPASVLLAKLKQLRLGKETVFGIIGTYAVLSTMLVWWHPSEGLAQVKANVTRFDEWNYQVQQQTEANSVIVSGITDKVFWPERQVIFALVNPVDYESVAKLLKAGKPVYWFHPTWPTADLATMNQRLGPFGLGLGVKAFGWQDFSLYEFFPVP